jgi:hypothetical protein
MKPVLMIHEITDQLFELPLQDYVLTFDDGLYSQYYHFDRFRDIPTEKIFFISSNIVCQGGQSTEFPDCRTAHQKAMNENYEDYMTIDQIRELMQYPDVTIGGHSHSHFDVSHMALTHKVDFLKFDTALMLSWFDHNLGIHVDHFCYPYNNDYSHIYTSILKQHGITHFYGSERIPAECLFTSPT